MADAEYRRMPDVPDWTQAFAALPQETPPTDAWSRMSAALPAAVSAPVRRAAPSRRLRRAAAAAAIGIAALGGWTTLQWSRPTPPSVSIAKDDGAASAADATTVAAPAAATDVHGIDTAPAAIATAEPRPTAEVRATAPRSPRAAVNRTSRSIAAVRSDDGARRDAVPEVRSAAVSDAARTRTLDELRGESARLEALVALVRQSGLQSGPGLVLTANIDDRLQLIDAALSRPALDEAERIDLWNRRVDALGELAAIEGTQRWMAAQGYSMDAVARVD